MPDTKLNIVRAGAAFSAQAPLFDEAERSNPILHWMRRQVYRHEEKFLRPGDSILELNAGTGIDAIYFARKGHTVFAIDIADGMLKELKKKVMASGLSERIAYAKCSFTELQQLPARRFDHVFSNFGGLNCIPDLRPVAAGLPNFLNPGATVTLVIMPRVCPWEMLHLLRGNVKFALRRFTNGGTTSRVEGHEFLSYYFSPSEVARSFGGRFRIVKLRGLASIVPPPYLSDRATKHPGVFRLLTAFDERCSALPPFNRWADHFIITFRFVG